MTGDTALRSTEALPLPFALAMTLGGTVLGGWAGGIRSSSAFLGVAVPELGLGTCFGRGKRANCGADVWVCGASIVELDESESVSSEFFAGALRRSLSDWRRGAIFEGDGDGDAAAVAYDDGGRGRPLVDEGLNPAGSAEVNFEGFEPAGAFVLVLAIELTVVFVLGEDFGVLDLACTCLLNSAKLLAVMDSTTLLHVHSTSHTGHMSSSSSAPSLMVCVRDTATVWARAGGIG